MNEWNLPTDKTIILLVILFKIVWKIWNRPSPKETLETLVNLEMERKGKLDLITREELKEALGVSGETLRNWEMMGLQRFQTPMERARKVYYRPSDIYLFLSVR